VKAFHDLPQAVGLGGYFSDIALKLGDPLAQVDVFTRQGLVEFG